MVVVKADKPRVVNSVVRGNIRHNIIANVRYRIEVFHAIKKLSLNWRKLQTKIMECEELFSGIAYLIYQ